MKLRLLWTLFCCCLVIPAIRAEMDTTAINDLNQQALDLAYSEPKKGFEIAQQALDAARRIGFSRGEVRALIRMGIIYDVQSNNKKAIEMYEQSLDLSKKTNDRKGVASNLNNLGLIYWKVNDLNKALNYFFRAYHLFRELKDEFNLASASNNIGLIYEELMLSRKALVWHRYAIRHCLNAKEEYFLYDVYSNIGNAFESLGQVDSSRFYTRKAIEGYRKINNRYGLAISLSNLGLSLNKDKSAEESLPYFKESMAFSKEIESSASYLSAGYNLGSAYKSLHRYKEQMAVLKDVYPIVLDLKPNELGFKVCFDLAQCYYREGNFEKGSELMRQYVHFHSAYYKEMLNKNISEAEKKFEVREERQRSKLLRQRSEFKLKRQADGRFMDNLIWTASLAVLLLAGLLVFFVVRKRNLQRELISQRAVFDATTEERKRISYDLHDHVGSQLSYVVNNLELIQHLDTANERVQRTFTMSQAAMSSLRDTVWALHSEELTMSALSERMENVARKTLESAETVQLSFDGSTSDSVIPQQDTMHIMRIFQEAVHNVVKHASATELIIRIAETEEEWNVHISDNGIGIADDPEKPFHYGLQSMKERAEKIGGILTVSAGIDGGTIVALGWPKK